MVKSDSLNPNICENVLPVETSEVIGRPLDKEETKNTIFAFKPLISPTDGLHPMFFQKYCNETKEAIINTCMKTFSSSSIPLEINKTFICLISKIKNPEQTNHYMPISLCSTIDKNYHQNYSQ